MKNKVTVAIINFNGRDTLTKTIESILSMDHPLEELLVVDDGSTDGSMEEVARQFPGVRAKCMTKNSGMLNKLRNIALREAKTRLVLVCDNDITFESSCLSNLTQAIETLPEAAICTPRMLHTSDPTRVYSEGHPMHYVGATIDEGRNLLARQVQRRPRRTVGGGTQLIDKTKLKDVGLFDEDFALGWGDDGEFHHRVNMSGLNCYSVPRAVVYHPAKRGGARYHAQLRNRWLIIAQSYSLRTILITLPALIAYEILVFFLVFKNRALGEYFAAAKYVFDNFGKILKKRRAVQRLRRVSDRELLHSGPIYIPPPLDKDRFIASGARALNRLFATYWSVVGAVL